jgi:MutS domain III
LDHQSRRNLEITQTVRNANFQGSLLWALDRTCTAMGGRTLDQIIFLHQVQPGGAGIQDNRAPTTVFFITKSHLDRSSSQLIHLHHRESVATAIFLLAAPVDKLPPAVAAD